MKTHFLLAFSIFLFSLSHNLHADYPLTSTDISKAYQSEKIIQKAIKAEGVLTRNLMRYLTNKKKPIELKIALINELGWQLGGKNNAPLFFAYLKQRYGYKNVNDFLEKADGNTIICMAYLKALDDYHNVKQALSWAGTARSKSKQSYTVNIICALIEAQQMPDTRWCKRYKVTNEVRKNKALTRDMNEAAVGIIFEYMDLYKEYC